MNIIREQNHENVPLLSGSSSDNNNVRLNIYDFGGYHSDDDSVDEGQNSNSKNETEVPTYTLTIDTNLDKSENENVLNSARPSFQSGFPSPFENESILKFYGGPVSDELCVPSGEYEVDKNKFIDKINGNNEDPFTLETFKDLIYMYAKKNKDFIIARIKTADPSTTGKYFYSYYDAHHINKVLFKTQPELSLLHRMQAKNPLNNMIIVGDVHYFVIKADYAKKVFKNTSFSLSSSNQDMSKSPLSAISPLSYINQLKLNKNRDEILKSDLIDFYRAANIKDKSVHDRHHTMPAYHVEDLASIAHKNLEKVLKVTGFSKPTKEKTYKRNQLKLIMKAEAFNNESIMKTINENTCESIAPKMRRKSDDYDYRKRKVVGRNYSYEVLNVVEIENGENEHASDDEEENENTVIFRAEFYATDDDFLMRRDVRTYFKENALEEKDSILFTLSNNTTIINEGNTIDSVQHPLLSFINYTFFDDTLTGESLNVFSSGIKWLLCGYFLFAFLLVKIWISTTVAIFVLLIGVIFMFFLYLLLL